MEPDKKELRKRLREKRAAAFLQEDGAKAGGALRDFFLQACKIEKDAVVSFYWPQGDEMDVLPLARALAQRGHRLVLPCTDVAARRLVFRSYAFGEALGVGPMGLREPLPDAPALAPDCLLVPLLGFDRAGRRLGQGGGFYDRALGALRAQGRVLAVGIAFAAQEIACVPTLPHDQNLDAWASERGFFLTDPSA